MGHGRALPSEAHRDEDGDGESISAAARLRGPPSTRASHDGGADGACGRAWAAEFRTAARERSGTTDAGRLLRHNVANILFESVTPEEALVSSYYTTFSEIGVDHMGRYRDRFVPAGDAWLIAHRYVTCDWRAEHSRF